MSTKNLARTVIEGGRAGGNRWERWSSNGRHRASERQALARVRRDDADAFEAPVRKKVYRGFADKLGPPKRWLARNVGRPWNLVRSELFARFDTRTTAGRHIVFDHMLRWVKVDETRSCFGNYAYFEIDRHGLLRHRRPN